jgi:hypothetical protein
MTINIQIDAEHLEKLAYIGQQTHRDPNTLLSQSIDLQYQQLQTQNATNGAEELFWSQDAYSYITKQSDLFDAMLPELISQYAGMYVLFEDGNVIDADLDEDILLVGVASPWRIECGGQISFAIESQSTIVSSVI